MRTVSQNAVLVDDLTSAILGTWENTSIYKGEKCQPYLNCCQLLRKEYSIWWKILLLNSEKHAIRWRKYQLKYAMLIDKEDIIGDQNVVRKKADSERGMHNTAQTWNTSWQEPDFRKCCQSNYKRIQKTGWFYSMQWAPVVSFMVQIQYTSLVRQNKISWPHQKGPLWKMVGQ